LMRSSPRFREAKPEDLVSGGLILALPRSSRGTPDRSGPEPPGLK
jgi:hypothetical protein